MSSKERHFVEPKIVDSQSEDKRLVRTAAIRVSTEEIFGSPDQARKWMVQNNTALGTTPLSMQESDAGFEEVRKVLASISYGGVV
jgi:uncharacterized protein (DUF2384 family)